MPCVTLRGWPSLRRGLVARPARHSLRAIRRDPDHHRRAGRRRDRSLRPHDCRPHGKDARPSVHCREQGWRKRQRRRAIHRRPAGRRQHHLARHPGLRRNPAERVQEFALVHRQLPPDHPRRRGAAGVHRPSGRAGHDLRRVPCLGEAEQGQAQLLLVSSRHAGALPRLPDEREVRPRSHPCALRRLRTAGQWPCSAAMRSSASRR